MSRTTICNSYPYRIFSALRDCKYWALRGFAAPSPHFIKQSCLVRNGYPDAIWVETGSYLGQTTKVLSKIGTKVFSIEPEPTLFENVKKYFANTKNIYILKGTSESVLKLLLPSIRGDINFWLDGHYSAGISFKGTSVTPILDELKCISQNIRNFNKICVLIDDIRCFNPHQPEYCTYPAVDVLVAWANQHNLAWHIEHDIFVAKTKTTEQLL